MCLFHILEFISFLFEDHCLPLQSSSTKWTVKLTEIGGSLAFWAPSKEFQLCIFFSFLYVGMKTKKSPPLKTGLQGLTQGWLFYSLSYPCTFLLLLNLHQLLLESDPQDHLRHPGMAKVDIIHFGLQTSNSHLSPRSQRRCYLNDFGNECVHQRQKDIVYCLCAYFVLWNIY